MNRLFQRLCAGCALAGATILLLGIVGAAAGARINTTKSIPLGLYWTTSSRAADRGAYVTFCPPLEHVFALAKARGYIGAGFCPGEFGFLMKRIAGIAGDLVSIREDGVQVNGTALPLSALMRSDRVGRPLPRYSSRPFVLDGDKVLLMSDVSATSFDGRYFGPVPRAQIRSVIIPVVTW